MSIPGFGGGSEACDQKFLGCGGLGEVGNLVGRDTSSVPVDSDTVCSSSVDLLFEVFVWQVLRFEGVLFASRLDFLRCFEPAVFKSLRPLVSFSGRDVRLLLRADDRDADGCGRDSHGDGGNKTQSAKRQAH